MLSPFIRHRLVLEADVLDAVLQHHSHGSAEKFIQEVFWRTYFKGWLEHHPDVWQRYRADLLSLVAESRSNRELEVSYRQAVGGETGIDCFDAWARELLATGYLHNHARMWFASIWVFTLRLPWQLGADFFFRHLIDGDPASNTLSWRWVCGLHTRGKTYLARSSNIAKYTNGRFDPGSALACTAAPLDENPAVLATPDYLAGPIPESAMCTADYENERFGLLMTEDDGHAESLVLPAPPAAVLGLQATAARSPLPVGRKALGFAGSALRDAARRAGTHYSAPAEIATSTDWGSEIRSWAARHQIHNVVVAAPPVGPVADILANAMDSLAGDIRISLLRRRYDLLGWPHAKKGFFQLKKKIPQILASL